MCFLPPKNIIQLLLVGIVALLSGCANFASLPAGTPAAERKSYISTRADQIFETQVDASQPGLSVMILKDNEIVYQRSKGMADIKQGSAITSDTAFNIASISKPITAIAIMQLVEQQKLTLEDPALQWLPQLPSNWKDIQIQHLLTHQSGIPFCFTDFERNTISEFDGLDNQALIQDYIREQPLLFAPGSSTKYCNINYVLLAEIISKASGMSYTQYLGEHIFTPLDMRSTYVYAPSSSCDASFPSGRDAVALSYGRTLRTFGIHYGVTGALGVFSSATDLSKLAVGLLTGKLIRKETLQQMLSDQLRAKSLLSDTYFGYGWLLYRPTQTLDIFYHPGDMDGYLSKLLIGYKQNYVFIALSNNSESMRDVVRKVSLTVQAAYHH